MYPVLLRILLSLALVLDGSGYAVASTMQAQGIPVSMSMSQSKSSDGHEASSPCGMHEFASSPEGQSDHPATRDPGHPAPDCCKSGACACANAQPVQFAPQSATHHGFANAQEHVVHPPQSKCTTPASRQPIRPPIG